MKHRWGTPNRPDNYKTERSCTRPGCGIIKVSHHEGNEHWTDFWRPSADGPPDQIATDRAPPCEGTE